MISLQDKIFFEKNGWCVIKNFFSEKELNKAKIQLKNFLKENLNNYSGRDINFTGEETKLSKLNSFHKLDESKYFNNLSKTNKISSLAKFFLSSRKLKLRACELFAKPAKIGLAAPVHQDNYYWCIKDHKALTIWVSLNRATEKNGGVFYFNGSHKYGIFDHEPSFKKGSSQKVKNLEKMKNRFSIETPELNPGDCLVHHCLTVHGSNKNISNYSRKGFTFQFVDFKSKLDIKQKKIYEKSLYKQLKLKRN